MVAGLPSSFMPFPLPIMVAFMYWQSAAIGHGFGTRYQYAKRKIDAMSNEEFNKLTQSKLNNTMRADLGDMKDMMRQSLADWQQMNPVIIQAMKEFFKDMAEALPQGIQEVGGSLGDATGKAIGTIGPQGQNTIADAIGELFKGFGQIQTAYADAIQKIPVSFDFTNEGIVSKNIKDPNFKTLTINPEITPTTAELEEERLQKEQDRAAQQAAAKASQTQHETNYLHQLSNMIIQARSLNDRIQAKEGLRRKGRLSHTQLQRDAKLIVKQLTRVMTDLRSLISRFPSGLASNRKAYFQSQVEQQNNRYRVFLNKYT